MEAIDGVLHVIQAQACDDDDDDVIRRGHSCPLLYYHMGGRLLTVDAPR